MMLSPGQIVSLNCVILVLFLTQFFFNGETMLYYSYFLKKFIKSFIVNHCFKLPSTYLVVCILLTFIKVHSCDNIFIKYYSHFSKSEPTFIHEDAP